MEGSRNLGSNCSVRVKQIQGKRQLVRVRREVVLFCIKGKDLNTPLCLLSDGHTDSDIVMRWKNPNIEIGNKEMAQFSVGDAVLSTKVNTFSTGKKSPHMFVKTLPRQGGSAPRSKPLPFYIPFLIEKVPLSYTFHGKL